MPTLGPQAAPSSERILPADAGPLPSPVGPLDAAPLEPALAGPHHPGGPAAAGLPPRGGGHDVDAAGQIDISERARGLTSTSAPAGPTACVSAPCAAPTAPASSSAGRRTPRALAPAVLASCAIPGYFRPVTIEGTEYVDGGVHSVTNADVLRSDGLDLVIIVSSMSADQGSVNGADGLLRRTVHRRMEREIARLEGTGTSVISLEPGPESRQAMGLRAMAEDRSSPCHRGRLRGDRWTRSTTTPVAGLTRPPC